jgi:hypothetical protein
MHICTHKHVFDVKLSELGVQMSDRHSEIVDVTPGHFSALWLSIGAFIALGGRRSMPQNGYMHPETCLKCEIQ